MFRIQSINHVREKIKKTCTFLDRRDVYAIMVVILVGISAYFLGQIGAIESNRPPVTIEK